jgi:flagellar biosynthesis/type III secretory pathway M-ring protein FliF/YscJ
MNEQTRTDLLNYLNNNNIEYKFDATTQQIIVDITVVED